MITADQLVAHVLGDYVLQSDWMAVEKTKRWFPACVHALTYAVPFLFLRPSLLAVAVIAGTHFAIDRWRLALCVRRAHILLGPWSAGRPAIVARGRPTWLTFWLLTVQDNILHVLINGFCLRYL